MKLSVLKLISAIIIFASAFSAFAKKTGKSRPEPETAKIEDTSEAAKMSNALKIKIGVLNGPSGVPMAYLMENGSESENIEFEFEKFASAQMELPKLLKGELDIGFLPPNVAAKVFTSSNRTLVALGITGFGNLSIISKNKSLTSLEDLKGKSIYCAGYGATPEYIFRYILSKKQISAGEGPDSIRLDFSIPNAELAASVISGKIEFALVPEPFATVAISKDPEIARIFDIQKEFATVNGELVDFPMTVMVANSKFIEKNKSKISELTSIYKNASDWTVENPQKAGILAQKHTLGLAAPIAAKSIPNANYSWITAKNGKTQLEKTLQIFLDFAPESIGGKLPENEFYFQ